nr:MAG TPA: hypothetical protein [Caudoviricetes sp.]
MILTVNGYDFEVGTISLKRDWNIAEKYRATTESGLMLREVRGIYLTYTLTLRNINSIIYDRLLYILTQKQNMVTVTLPMGAEGTITFQAFFTAISDELVKTIGNEHHWDNLSIKFETRDILN